MRPVAAVLLGLGLVVLPLRLSAQVPVPPAPDTMLFGILHKMVGRWEGTAWMMTQLGKETVQQREEVRRVAGGTVIHIEGVGSTRDSSGKERIVHNAFAVVHLDREMKAPQMRAFVSTGLWLDVIPTITSTTLTWGREDPRAGTLRYDTVIDAAGRWVEKGFMSRDGGQSWTQIMEMTLTRQANKE